MALIGLSSLHKVASKTSQKTDFFIRCQISTYFYNKHNNHVDGCAHQTMINCINNGYFCKKTLFLCRKTKCFRSIWRSSSGLYDVINERYIIITRPGNYHEWQLVRHQNNKRKHTHTHTVPYLVCTYSSSTVYIDVYVAAVLIHTRLTVKKSISTKYKYILILLKKI